MEERDAAAQAEEETSPEAQAGAGPGPEDLLPVPERGTEGEGGPRAQEGVERVPVRVPGPPRSVSYLVRTEDGDGSMLQLFTYDPKYDVHARGELVAYLASLIELNRLAIGPAVAGIWRWDPDDSRHELQLDLADVRPELDGWQDEYWEVVGGGDEVISFIVSISRKG